MADSLPLDLKREMSLSGSDTTSKIGDWDVAEELRLRRKIDLCCMASLNALLFLLPDLPDTYMIAYSLCSEFDYITNAVLNSKNSFYSYLS
jgi:hypothetical protein